MGPTTWTIAAVGFVLTLYGIYRVSTARPA